jgi:hypothetical protein
MRKWHAQHDMKNLQTQMSDTHMQSCRREEVLWRERQTLEPRQTNLIRPEFQGTGLGFATGLKTLAESHFRQIEFGCETISVACRFTKRLIMKEEIYYKSRFAMKNSSLQQIF